MKTMTISEVASEAGIRASAIRYYERCGVLPPAARLSGRRQYDGAVLKQLAVVTLAREAGFTIREVRALFRDFGADATASMRWRTTAAGKLQELEGVLRRTRLMRGVVRAMMACRCKTLEQCGETILRGRNARRQTSARLRPRLGRK
jgi:MerR family redox-sensitive transcriptional activator SoxR